MVALLGDFLSFILLKVMSLVAIAAVIGIVPTILIGCYFWLRPPTTDYSRDYSITDVRDKNQPITIKELQGYLWGALGAVGRVAHASIVFLIAITCVWWFLFTITDPHTIPNSWMTRHLTSSFDEHRTWVAPNERITKIESRIEIHRYKILAWNPPKHFYVTIKHLQTGYVFESFYVSKHCNDLEKNFRLGEEINLQTEIFVMSNDPTPKMTPINLYSSFCG